MIKIVFASNWFNHHEKYMCDAFYNSPGVSFKFIQTQRIPEERLRLGYKDMTKDCPYLISSYESEEANIQALEICNAADILILGSAPYEFVSQRVRENKLTFYYAERLFRKGVWRLLNPRTFFNVLRRFILPGRRSNFYMLCASAYTSMDCHTVHAFKDKYFKWGHFVNVSKQESIEELIKRKKESSDGRFTILWAGRFIPLKHPDAAIYVADRLKKDGYNFKLCFIGTGYLEKQLKSEVNRKGLTSEIQFMGPMSPDDVRRAMEISDVFLFTSDFNEGWGAVLGEAMASGCAVVSSHGIGATPFLAQNEYNALIYETNNWESLYRNVIRLLNSHEFRDKVSVHAISTMRCVWNAEIAVSRFISVAEALMRGAVVPQYENGPMSTAQLLNNKWFKDDTK